MIPYSGLITALWLLLATGALAQHSPMIGIDCNYAMEMAGKGKGWKNGAESVDPFDLFAAHGCQNARIRLWVGDVGINRLSYAAETARRAKKSGLKPYLVIFLSDNWADLVKQPVPAVWKNLSSEERLAAIEAYTEDVVRKMAESGVEFDTFEIGNEIDFGICGEFEEEWPRRVSLEYMRTQIWPRMIPILKAAQSGVRRAQPKAKFILHLAQWNNLEYCIAFWKAMQSASIQLDLVGLSYFPSSAKDPSQRSFKYLQAEVAKISEAVKKPVLICEAGYPAATEFEGQFADWNLPAECYPLSADGQAKWIADLTVMVRNDPNFAGVFYWSPEWYNGGLWDAFSLFNRDGVARPGATSFQQ